MLIGPEEFDTGLAWTLTGRVGTVIFTPHMGRRQGGRDILYEALMEEAPKATKGSFVNAELRGHQAGGDMKDPYVYMI